MGDTVPVFPQWGEAGSVLPTEYQTGWNSGRNMTTDPHRELRDNLSNIDPAWRGEIEALLADRDHLLRVLQVENGEVSAAPEGWIYTPKVPAEMWVWNGPVTYNVRPIIIRKSAGAWELRQKPDGGMALTFPTALEAMLAEPPWDSLEDGETQEITLW